MIAAILRCIYAFTVSTRPSNSLFLKTPYLIRYVQNTQANGLVIAIWSCREAFVAMIVGNVPMIKPIVSRYSTKWSASSSAQNKSVGSDSSRSVELGSRNQNHSLSDSERQSSEDSESMKHIVGKGEGLEICTNKTYEVTYENSVQPVVLQERVHSLNMAYTAQARIAGGNGNNV